MIVEWNGTRDDTISGYFVYRRRRGGEWEKAAFVELRADDERNRGVYAFEERADTTHEHEYTVAAVGRDGRPGPKTVEIQ